MRTPVAIYGDTEWQRRGLCYQSPVAHALLFSAASMGKGAPSAPEVRRGKAICGVCQVRDECLTYALETAQPFGIWGGLLPQERRRLVWQRS